MKLKNIKLYEEFTESKNFLIKKYFDELSKKIENWFTEGSLSIDGLEFLNMDKYNTVGGMTKTLSLKFKDMQYQYSVDILIDHDMFEENELKNCYLSIKLYSENDELLTTDTDSNVDINNLTEDYLIEKISKIKEDMRRFLGEEPGLDIVYKKDVMINEFTGESKEFLDIDKVQIVFTDSDDKFKKIEFIVSENI